MTPRDDAAATEYIGSVIDQLRPVLLSYARMCDRLGVEAPPPQEIAQTLVDHWLAARDGSGPG
jgi:hypothetical protein